MAKQSLHQSLQQKLSPQQIQLMKLIELSTLEIEQKIKFQESGYFNFHKKYLMQLITQKDLHWA